MDDSDRAVRSVHTSEKRQSDGMVATKCYYSRQSPPFLRQARLFRIRGWLSHEDGVVAFLNLVNSPGIVVAVF
jgi:hypothetical protein